MKIKEGYIIKKVAGSNIIVPINNPYFKSIMTLNESGAFLFEKLMEQTDKSALCDALCAEFNVDEKTAMADVDSFVNSLIKAKILDE